MKRIASRNRKQLKNKLAIALSTNIKELTIEMQDILLDDLITAFESRYEVLNGANWTWIAS